MKQGALPHLTSWYSDWSGLKVVVLGLSDSGFSVADTLCELGSEVLVLSESAKDEFLKLLPVIGAKSTIGASSELVAAFESFKPDLVVASPGFAPHNELVQLALAQDVPLWGDIELAWRVRDKVKRADGTAAEWILITGTNGKTTTTRLTATMLRAGGLRTAPVGNIGTPVLDAIRDPAGFDVLAVELSSHQLWYLFQSAQADPVSPLASVCLNLASDHLKWHGSFDAYREAKSWVYNATKIACVYNKADLATLEMVEEADVVEGARAIGFDLGSPGPSDFGVVDGILVDRAFAPNRRHEALELITVPELAALGLNAPHLISNILAAAALSRAAGISVEAVALALEEFRLDPHRIELIAEESNIRWVNDSKATNPHASQSSLQAFPGAIWIAGGLLKGVDISDLVAANGPGVKAAILIGTEQEPFVTAFKSFAPEIPVTIIDPESDDVMLAAVETAADLALPGDTVLLAPAAASFDQFDSFEHRGESFRAAVTKYLRDKNGSEDSEVGV